MRVKRNKIYTRKNDVLGKSLYVKVIFIYKYKCIVEYLQLGEITYKEIVLQIVPIWKFVKMYKVVPELKTRLILNKI